MAPWNGSNEGDGPFVPILGSVNNISTDQELGSGLSPDPLPEGVARDHGIEATVEWMVEVLGRHGYRVEARNR